MTPTAVQTDKHPIVRLREQLTQRSDDLRNALPKYISPEKFTSAVLVSVQLNPDLLTVERASLWNACLKAAADGLIPDNRDAALVVFKSKDRGMIAQYLPMVGGLLKRFRNSGQFRSIAANVVREGEPFEFWVDEHGEHLKHVPGDGGGKIMKAYAVANLKDGGVMVRVMSVADIEKRRAVSRMKDGGIWREWYEEMCLKTVLRNLAKRLPMSSDLDQLVRESDEEFDLEHTEHKDTRTVADVTSALDHFATGGESAPDEEQDEAPAADTSALRADLEHSVAYEEGKEARRAGVQRRAVPPNYRTPEAAAKAKHWIEGWDQADTDMAREGH